MLNRPVLPAVLLACCLALPVLLHAQPREGDTWQEPATGMVFVWVGGGVDKPNSGPIARDGYYGDDDPRSVPRVDGFWLGRCEVTQGQWRAVMGGNPSAFAKGDAYPVESVSLPEVQEFIARLNASGSARFRLPTNREWSFAARSGGLPGELARKAADKAAWHAGNSRGSTHPVGSKAPDKLGLHDLSGNVRELCGDGGPARPDDPLAGLAFCGGGWDDGPSGSQALGLALGPPDARRNDVGLRLLREP